MALETKGTVREARGLASEDVHLLPHHGVLHVQKPPHPEGEGQAAGVVPDLLQGLLGDVDGGKEGGRVPGVDPGPLHVLHDPGHHDLLPVREGVHVQLYGPLQEAVQEDGGPLLQGA